MPSGLWLPRRYVKPTAIVYWYSERLNHIRVGLPEQYPIPEVLQAEGYNKIVCRNAHEVEKWSAKLRDQERRDKEIADAERERIEGPIRDALRADMLNRRANAHDSKNRDFMQGAIEQADKYDAERRDLERRTSFQHCEGFEEGH